MTIQQEFNSGRENSMENFLMGIIELRKKEIKNFISESKFYESKKPLAYWLGRLRGLGDVRRIVKRDMVKNESYFAAVNS